MNKNSNKNYEFDCCPDCNYKSSKNCCVKWFNSVSSKSLLISGIITLSLCVLINVINLAIFPYNNYTKIFDINLFFITIKIRKKIIKNNMSKSINTIN